MRSLFWTQSQKALGLKRFWVLLFGAVGFLCVFLRPEFSFYALSASMKWKLRSVTPFFMDKRQFMASAAEEIAVAVQDAVGADQIKASQIDPKIIGLVLHAAAPVFGGVKYELLSNGQGASSALLKAMAATLSIHPDVLERWWKGFARPSLFVGACETQGARAACPIYNELDEGAEPIAMVLLWERGWLTWKLVGVANLSSHLKSMQEESGGRARHAN